MSRMSEQQLFARALLDLLSPHNRPIAQPRVWVRHDDGTEKLHNLVRSEACDNDTHWANRPAVVVERPTSNTITVRWSDSRSGYYGEQLWRMTQSRTRGLCAATGLSIDPGDVVFKPYRHKLDVPFNRDQMILASAIGGIAADATQ
jgi:hypothetical protein